MLPPDSPQHGAPSADSRPPDRPRAVLPGPLLQAVRRLLRPLVRLMMQSGLTYPILADSLRRLFVEIAVTDILIDPKARSDSRISLLTGVHRKEIRRLREMPPDPLEAPDIVTLASQIVARWIGSAPFADDQGRPKPLHRIGNGETEPSFVDLVASVTSDVRPRAVLDDLLGHDAVFVDAADRVQLHAEAFIPRPGGEEQLFYFARNLHDHVAAAVGNIGATGSALFLDRSVHYDRLTVAQARELREYARAAAMRALLDVNRRALELTADSVPAADGPADQRVNFGAYVFDEHEPPVAGGDT
jgi:hypothetical protein